MSTHKNIDRICILVLVLTLLLTVAFMNGEKLGIRAIADEDAESYSGTAYFTANDLDGTWSDNAYTTYITLSGDTAAIKGSGAYAYDGGVVITNGGWYVLSGTLTDGSIVVDAYDSSKVWLRLEGVDVACSDDACLIIDQADKVFLTLAEGSENSFTSGASYSSAALEDNTGGAIFAHDDLTINGSGSLTITANYKHGIDANDSLVITGGTITVTAPQDGIHVNDSFRFIAANLTICAGDDAVHSDAELYVESGTILITECYEGLEAVTIDIVGGDITVYPSDDGLNANGSGSGIMGGFGSFGGMGGMRGNGTEESNRSADSKDGTPPEVSGDFPGKTTETQTTQTAVAEETYIRISGGTITIINENGNDADGLDSNGSIYIDGGTVRISLKGDGSNCAIDYGSESGGELIVTGGTIIACGGSSMAEAFSSSSTQCAVLYNLSSTVAADTRFRIQDASGNELLSYAPQCSYSSVAFSAPELTAGETYTVCVGEAAVELTLNETATQVGENTGMGGMGEIGGDMRPGDMRHGDDMTLPEQGQDGTGDSSERPTPPDWAESGEDRFGDTPADWNESERGQPGGNPFSQDSGEGSSGDSLERPTPPDHGNGFGGAEDNPAVTQNTSGAAGETSVSAETWLLLGTAALVLAAGILFAFRFKRY